MDVKHEDEVYLVSSDTESEFGDENNLFYDEESNTKQEIRWSLGAFDSDSDGLSNVYQEKFLPKLKDKSHNFMKWLIDTDLLSSSVRCPNAEKDPQCSEDMEFVLAVGLYDLYQLRCKNCCSKESIRKGSIFSGLKCNLRSVIRILYGWVKGIDLEIMSNMLNLDRKIVGTIYNRAARVALCCMSLCPGLGEFGGNDVVVLIDIYPDLLGNMNIKSKPSRPILCISEIESLPQKYWLEPLDPWDKSNPEEVEKVKRQVMKLIFTLVKPGSIVVLPNNTTLPLMAECHTFEEKYPTVKYMHDLMGISTVERPFTAILDTIWKKPLSMCEQAQFFNPDYVSQFLVKQMWKEMIDKDSFIMLISFIVYETRRKSIESGGWCGVLGSEAGKLERSKKQNVLYHQYHSPRFL